MRSLEGVDHDGHNAINSLRERLISNVILQQVGTTDLLNNAEAISVITMEYVRAHKGENGHDIAKYGVRREASESGHEEQGLIECLGILRDYVVVSIAHKYTWTCSHL